MHNKRSQVCLMVQCHNCGKNLTKPDKKIENAFFCIEVYTCHRCGAHFKLTY